MSKRIYIVLTSLHIGGITSVISNQIDSFHKSGAEVHLVLFRHSSETTLPNNCKVHILDLHDRDAGIIPRLAYNILRGTHKGLGNPLSSFIYTRSMNNLIAREGEADGIFIHSIKACSSLRSFNHPKKVTILHAIKSEMLAKHSGIALYIRRNAIRKTYTNSIIVAVSWEIKKDFMLSYNIPSERIHIIHNGIDTHAIKKKAKTYSPPVKAPYLVYIGRMEKIKGPDILLTAFMSIKRNDLKLVFIGGGSLLNHLKERALNAEGKTIIFTGPLENPMPYLQKATYSVMPSRSEGLGMSALESLALETPVIASDLDVFSEFESEGLLFFKTENHEDLTKKIEELALNRPMPAQLSKKFDIALSAKNYLNIIS